MDKHPSTVSFDAVAKAVECSKSHACLADPEFSSCEFTSVLDGQFCCLKQPCQSECNYCIALDQQYFCDCPVKKELCSSRKRSE